MKTKIIETKSRAEAKKLTPWAAKIVKIEGGFMAFENIQDFKIWKNQK